MARPIKFRAWNEKTKQMRKGAGLPMLGITLEGGILNVDEMAFTEDWTLLQFTGQKDRAHNGVEIFEGDIVKLNGAVSTPILEVRFEYGKFGCDAPWGYFTGLDEDWDFEVIGNIYENPEIIKKSLEGQTDGRKQERKERGKTVS